MTVTVDELHEALAAYDAGSVTSEISTPRYKLKYVRWGSGHPLLFVHGMADQPRSFSMLMHRLVPDHACVGYHLASGRGDGARLGAYQHSDFAHDLIALLDHLGLESVDLFGSSFGTTISMTAASLYPHRIRRLILQGGFARRPLIRPERGLARLARYWPGCMENLPLRDRIMRKLEASAFVSAPTPIFDFLIHNSGKTPCRAAARRSLMIDKMDLRPLLPRLTLPVLMLGGDRDSIVPWKYEKELLEGLPNVRRIEYTRCGHYPQYTHPQDVAQAVRDFLTSA